MVQANIVVVGAGVSGLTTAVELKKSHPSYDITIVSSHLPGDISPDFTSPFAGANWHSFATIEDKRLQTYDLEGYKRLVQLAETDPKSGIWANDSYCFYSQSAVEEMGNKKPDPWYKHKVENYQTIPPEQLLPGTAHGYRFKGVVITVPIYLNYLLQKALEMGIAIKRVSALKEIGSARQLHSSGKRADVVVNCTGLLAKNIKGYRDPNRQYPVLGQVLHVRNNARTEFAVDGVDPSRPDESLYIFPRKEGGSIIGGCHRENFDSTDEDKELTKRLIDRAIKYAPELIDRSFKNNPEFMDIITVGVGQRPFRDGGVRVEQDPDLHWLVHNYGAGAGGYQGSYGFSSEAVRLVRMAAESIHSKI